MQGLTGYFPGCGLSYRKRATRGQGENKNILDIRFSFNDERFIFARKNVHQKNFSNINVLYFQYSIIRLRVNTIPFFPKTENFFQKKYFSPLIVPKLLKTTIFGINTGGILNFSEQFFSHNRVAGNFPHRPQFSRCLPHLFITTPPSPHPKNTHFSNHFPNRHFFRLCLSQSSLILPDLDHFFTLITPLPYHLLFKKNIDNI